MKKIYFVRHGITSDIENQKYQFPSTSLSDAGIKQAEFVADRMAKISIDTLISSDMERARQTAKIISSKIGLPITESPFFRERRMPSEIFGKDKMEKKVFDLAVSVDRNIVSGLDTHISDEENFIDLKKRVIQALDFLEQSAGKNICVVTHGFILRFIFAVMIFGEDLAPAEFGKINRSFLMSNTGITVFEYDENRKDYLNGESLKWRFLTWNDHAHLG